MTEQKEDVPRDLFSKMPDRSTVAVFDHELAFGFYVSWSEKGTGFGTLSFSVDKATGEATFNDESMSLESCARILRRLIGGAVCDIDTVDREVPLSSTVSVRLPAEREGEQ